MTTDVRQPTNPPKRKRPRWIKGVVIGGIVAVALVVGGPFVYINFIEGDPPAELSLDSQQATAPSAGTTEVGAVATIDGTWKVASGSQAGYRVKEVLFGQNTTAVGRTSGVTGQMIIAGTTVRSAEFTADMTTVTSDQSQRDNQFRGRIMETSRYPTAKFTLTTPIDLGSVPTQGERKSYQAAGDLTIHGVTRSVTMSLEAERAGALIRVVGQIPTDFRDYGVNDPSFTGIEVDGSSLVIEVLLNFEKS